MSGLPLLLLHLSQNFQFGVKEILIANVDTFKHWKIAISQILKCYILSPPLLLLQLSQNLHVGVKDVQKNIFYLECTICQVLHFYYFILAKNFKLGWKMYQIWASMIIYQLNRGKIRNSVIEPNCNWGCLCFFLIGQ